MNMKDKLKRMMGFTIYPTTLFRISLDTRDEPVVGTIAQYTDVYISLDTSVGPKMIIPWSHILGIELIE